MKLKKLTLEERINNIENHIRKLESVLISGDSCRGGGCPMISKERSTKTTKVKKNN